MFRITSLSFLNPFPSSISATLSNKFQRGANCSSFWFMPCQSLSAASLKTWRLHSGVKCNKCEQVHPLCEPVLFLSLEGQRSTHSHRNNVTMITHDKLSYLIRSHPENGRKRNSTAASVQKSCLDNQHCTQWFPSPNTHNFAAAADSESTWLFSHAKISKPHPSQSSDFALFIPQIKNGFQLSAAPGYWLLPTNTAHCKGPKWGLCFSQLSNFQVIER